MQDTLISYKTAFLAKERGFDEICYDNVWNDGCYSHSGFAASNSDYTTIRCSAPTQSLLQKWLREKYNIFVTVDISPYCKNIYSAGVLSLSSKNQGERLLDGFTMYPTYEEALEEGLREALKLINLPE